MTPGRWLLLGGDGYVGRHLARELALLGADVSSFDRRDGDLRAGFDPARLAAADAVVLLAGVVRTPSPAELTAANVEIAQGVADAYGAAAVRPPLCFLSSLHVYATSAAPVGVDSPSDPSRTPYGTVKLACEALLTAAAAAHRFPLWIGRAGNLVARVPPVNPLSFVADMQRGLLEDGRVVVRNAPQRDVVWIEDLAAGLVRRVGAGLAPGRAVVENVCTGRAIELALVAELAVARRRALGHRAVCVSEPGGPDVLVGVPPPDRAWGAGPTAADLAALIAGG